MGFTETNTEALLAIRSNLLAGLDRVAGHLTAGTFEQVGPKGAAPPSQSGNLTLWLLDGIDAEITRRGLLANTPAAT